MKLVYLHLWYSFNPLKLMSITYCIIHLQAVFIFHELFSNYSGTNIKMYVVMNETSKSGLASGSCDYNMLN